MSRLSKFKNNSLKVCSKIHFIENSYKIETNQLIYIANQLNGFHAKIQILTETYLPYLRRNETTLRPTYWKRIYLTYLSSLPLQSVMNGNLRSN